MINIQKVLFPTDCSENSEDALAYAIEITKKFNAKLLILNVTSELEIYGGDNDYLSPANYKKMVEAADADSKKQLKAYWEKFEESDIKVELMQVKGDPFKEIVLFAQDNKMDIIVMGTHGRTGIQHIMMGSVAEKIVRYSPIPVLTVKNKKHEYVPV